MSTSQHTPSRVDGQTETSGGAPVVHEEDVRASGRANHLGLYGAVAGGALFVVAVLIRGAGQVGLVVGSLAMVLFVLAVCLNLPGIDTDAMMSDRARAASAAERRDGGM